MSVVFAMLSMVSNNLPVLGLRGFFSLFFLQATQRILLIMPCFIVHHHEALFYFYSVLMTWSLLGWFCFYYLFETLSLESVWDERSWPSALFSWHWVCLLFSKSYLFLQQKYIADILEHAIPRDLSLADSPSISTSRELNLKFCKDDCDPLPQPT